MQNISASYLTLDFDSVEQKTMFIEHLRTVFWLRDRAHNERHHSIISVKRHGRGGIGEATPILGSNGGFTPRTSVLIPDNVSQRASIVSTLSGSSITPSNRNPSPDVQTRPGEDSIKAALQSRSRAKLLQLLTNHFDQLTDGPYVWLRELDELGYSRDDIADILLGENRDSPWIYFEARREIPITLDPTQHLPGCIHQGGSKSELDRVKAMNPAMEQNLRRTVHEFCGLAGVSPNSRVHSEWNGRVHFETSNETAAISYSLDAESNSTSDLALLQRMERALKGVCYAISAVQEAGLCCSSFTILSLREDDAMAITPACHAEVRRIGFDIIEELLAELDDPHGTRQLRKVQTMRLKPLSLQILALFNIEIRETALIRYDQMQLCSLAIQVLSLGFLSYCQAHIGPIQPTFLGTPLKQITLLGAGRLGSSSIHIIAELTNLSCMSGMTRGPVLTFRAKQPLSRFSPSVNLHRYDVLACAEDLLDTWGPGQLVKREESRANLYSALRIGGGVICAADDTGDKWHWSLRAPLDALISVRPRQKIMIGAVVSVSTPYINDEKQCWEKSGATFDQQGT